MNPADRAGAEVSGRRRRRASEWASGKRPLPRGSGWKRGPEILAAAGRLLQAFGPDAVTIRRIAAEVGVTSTLLYSHFPSLAALLEALCRSHLEDLLRQMTNAGAAMPGEARRRRLAAYLEFAFTKPEVYRLAFAPLAQTAAQGGLQAGGTAEARAIWAMLSADPAPASARAEAGNGAWLAGAAHGIALVLTSAAGAGHDPAKSPRELADRLAWMAEAVCEEADRPAAMAMRR